MIDLFEDYENIPNDGLRPIGVPLNELGGMEDGSYERSLVLKAINGDEDFITKFISEGNESEYIGNLNKDFVYIQRKEVDEMTVDFIIKVEFDGDEDGIRGWLNEIIEVEGIEIDIKSFTKDEQKKINDFISNLQDHLHYRDDLDETEKSLRYAGGGGVDWYDFDKKMALINLNQINEYAIKLDNIVTEDTELEEWIKMKLTRVEQNIADIKHSLSGWEKFEEFGEGGRIFKKQLLHIAKYSKDLIAMIKLGSKLMSWQENKLAISADYIDGIYHHLDYIRKTDLDKLDEYLGYANGGGVGDKVLLSVGSHRAREKMNKAGISYVEKYGLETDTFGKHYYEINKKDLKKSLEITGIKVANPKGKLGTARKFVNGGGIKTDFNELENTELRNVLISFWNDFFNNHIGNYLSIEKENYILSNIDNVFVIVRDKDKGNFSDVEKQSIDRFLSPYFDSNKKPLFADFFNNYEIKDNKIIIYIKDMYANGGGVKKVKTIKESDIQVGKKFNLITGDVIEIKRLFIENIDQNWVEYTFKEETSENSVNQLKNFINHWRGEVKYYDGGGVGDYSEYSNDALQDMIINLSRYENTEDDIKIIKEELERRKSMYLVDVSVNEISKNQLENMVGKKLDGWNDDIVYYGGKKYQKCYLRPYYKVC